VGDALVYVLMVLVIALIASYGVGIHAFKGVTIRRRHTPEENFDFIEKEGLYTRSEFEELPKEEVELKSNDGLMLKGTFIEEFKDNKKVIIIVHGYTATYAWSTQFLNMFFKEGFNVLLVDQRSHGRSEGKYATYGYYEKYDLDLWVNWVCNRVGEDAIIGLHGQSMGGGTVLEYTGINKYVKFIIADCPYSDAMQLMKHQFNKLNNLPMIPFIYFTNMRLKWRAKFSLRNVSPINVIKDKQIPIMFIHGSKDNFVPTYMSEDMYKIKKGYKKLLIIEGAVHGNAYGTDKELYEKEVHNFLAEVLG
jgi:fermentation-respiration switch protein FrsA (DUF1100 family)